MQDLACHYFKSIYLHVLTGAEKKIIDAVKIYLWESLAYPTSLLINCMAFDKSLGSLSFHFLNSKMRAFCLLSRLVVSIK